jgi:hypothetical protein
MQTTRILSINVPESSVSKHNPLHNKTKNKTLSLVCELSSGYLSNSSSSILA